VLTKILQERLMQNGFRNPYFVSAWRPDIGQHKETGVVQVAFTP
jgi:hypothetical protein